MRLATANALKGNRDQALQYLKECIQYRPENRFLATRDTDFESLQEDPEFKHLVPPQRSESKKAQNRLHRRGDGAFDSFARSEEISADLSVIVTVTDDGGSSGRLREEFGVLPPGDIRNCMIALSEDEQLMSRLFRFRFNSDGGLHDHSFGNLFLTAMAGVTR